MLKNSFQVTIPFTNIIKAEQKHLDAVLYLYDYYDLEVISFDVSEYFVIPSSLDSVYSIGIDEGLEI